MNKRKIYKVNLIIIVPENRNFILILNIICALLTNIHCALKMKYSST